MSEDRPACLACGGVATRVRFAVGALATAPLLECRQCGLLFLAVRDGDRERHGGTYHEARAAQTDLREAAAQAALMLAYWARRLEWTSADRILEVGCAEGTLLHVAKAMHLTIEGIDVSPFYAARWSEEELPATVCTLEEYSHRGPRGLAAVIARQVFEHLSAPLAFLKACAEVLAPGGVALIETGDSQSLQARVLGARWAYWVPAEGLGAHVAFLNERAARGLASLAGLELLAVVPYGRYRPPPGAGSSFWQWVKYGAHRTRLSGGKCYVFRRPGSSELPNVSG